MAQVTNSHYGKLGLMDAGFLYTACDRHKSNIVPQAAQTLYARLLVI